MTKIEALQEVAALSKGITHDAGQLLDLLGTAAWQAPIPGTDRYVVAGTLAMIGAAAVGTPIAPASADNPSTAGDEKFNLPTNEELEDLWFGTHYGHPADFGADVLERWGGWQSGLLGYGGSLNGALAAPVAQSTAGAALLSKERITEVGLKLRIQAFEHAKFRADEGSTMTEPEQDEFNQQVEFARAIWRLAATPQAQSTAGAAKGGNTGLEVLPRYDIEMFEVGNRYVHANPGKGKWVEFAEVERLLAAPAAQAPTPTAAEVRNQALEEAAVMLLNGRFLHDEAPPKLFANEAAKAIREMKTASKDQASALGEKGGDDASR